MAVRFTLTLLLVTFLVGTGVKAGLREMAKNDILKHPEVYKNAPKLGMTPEEYYMKYIAPKKYPELTKPSVVVGFNALVSSVKPPQDKIWRKLELYQFRIPRKEALLRTLILLFISEIILVPLSLMVAFWALKSPKVAGILNNLARVVLGIPAWWPGVVFILLIIYSPLPNDLLIFPGPGAELLDILESMLFPVLTVVLTSFWYLAVEFYFLLSREVLNPYVSYKRAMGLPENRILMSALRAISVPALSIWFSHLIEVEGIVIVVDHLFKLGGLGQMIGSSFSGSMAETFYFIPSLFAFLLLAFIVLNLIIAMAVEFLKTRLDPRGITA